MENYATAAPAMQTAREMAQQALASGRPLSITAPDAVRREYWRLQRKAVGEPLDELDLHELVSYVVDLADVLTKLGEM